MEIKQTQDTCVDKLTSTSGEDLQIMANITGPQQMATLLEGHIYSFLGSQYVPQKAETLLRLTVSYQGRGRTDLTDIARSQKLPGWGGDGDGKNQGGGL